MNKTNKISFNIAYMYYNQSPVFDAQRPHGAAKGNEILV